VTILVGIAASRSVSVVSAQETVGTEADEAAKRNAQQVVSKSGDDELLRFAFTDPLIPGDQILKPITSLAGIHAANRSMLTPVELFFDAYDRLEILDAKTVTINDGSTELLRLSYRLGDRPYQAYAYVRRGLRPVNRAALVIPGSALNLSSRIVNGDPKSNHTGIMLALGDDYDRFVFIKPNEDCLAFHDGRRKLNVNFLVNWQLDAGSSYSVHYIVHTLAFSKYLKQKYPTLVVAGLSQGGAAALLNVLQSQPTAAVIASGFSIINQQALWSGHNQIIIPGLRKRLSHETIRDRIRKLRTQFLFTYGKKEVGTYRIETTAGLSREFLSPCKNVEVRVHDGGHEYPTQLVAEFLRRSLSPDSGVPKQ